VPSVTVRYWAGAQRAAGTETETLSATTIGDLRAQLQARPALAKIAAVASFLVDGAQAGDTTVLSAGAEVDVLPPFAGGAGGADRLTLLVSGQVQGVGFRYWVRREAESLGLAGAATNLPDGRVEVVVEGPREACEALLAAVRSNGTPGRVTEVTPSWSAATGMPPRFVVR
jgi:acylphosphatase